MNTVSDEDVVAYVDGNLGEDARRAFEAELANDPDLARRVSAHRWMSRQITAAFDGPPNDDMDEEELERLGLSDSKVVPMAGKLPWTIRRSAFAAVLTGAMAASLVAGVVLDRALINRGSALVQTDAAGQVLAQGKLADSLSDHVSGQPGLVRIGLTFRTDHTVCRTFSTRRGLSGIGCRRKGRWVIPIFATNPPETRANSEYQLAGDNVAPSVMADVDRRMVGEPLSIAQEKALIADGWKAHD